MQFPSPVALVGGTPAFSAAVITGFNPVSRTWITRPGVVGGSVAIPSLSGMLVPATTPRIGTTVPGGISASCTTVAMLLPGKVDDIVRMMRFCGEHGIAVASIHAKGTAATGPVMNIRVPASPRQRPTLHVVSAD